MCVKGTNFRLIIYRLLKLVRLLVALCITILFPQYCVYKHMSEFQIIQRTLDLLSAFLRNVSVNFGGFH